MLARAGKPSRFYKQKGENNILFIPGPPDATPARTGPFFWWGPRRVSTSPSRWNCSGFRVMGRAHERLGFFFVVGSFTGQYEGQGVSLLIRGVLESASDVATGWGANGGLGATGCHPGCSVSLENGQEIHTWKGWQQVKTRGSISQKTAGKWWENFLTCAPVRQLSFSSFLAWPVSPEHRSAR